MPRGEKDHGTNWMIQHHPAALLRFLGVPDVRSCRTAHPRLTLPQAIPDGLLEARLPGHDQPLPFLLEVEAYPSPETDEQMARDLDLAELALGVLPDAAVIVLCRRGRRQAPGRAQQSALGWSVRRHRWRVVELWKVPAEELLAMNEVGLVPFVPLARTRERPAALLQRCWERIEQQGRPDERATLLTITSIMATMRYTGAERWIEALGGKTMLAESPLYQKWMAEKECETKQEAILRFLLGRFGEVPEAVAAQVRAVTDLEKLDAAIDNAARCGSLDAFRKRLARS
jgi:hypothetical protein